MKKNYYILILLLAIIALGVFNFSNLDKQKVVRQKRGDFREEVGTCLDNYLSINEAKSNIEYIVSFITRQFEPQNNSHLALWCFNKLPTGKKYYALLQLYDAPSKQERETLERYGINLLNYIPKNSWFANFSNSFDEKATQELNGLIRWVGTIYPQDKTPKDVWDGKFGDWAVSNGSVLIVIAFFEDVGAQEAEELIGNYEGDIIGKIGMSNKYTVKINKEYFKKILEENIVRFVDRIPPPPTTNVEEGRK